MRLSSLIANMNLTGLVPARYHAYLPLVSDSLGYFLDRLSPARQARIVEQQLALGADTALDLRLTCLFAHCPTLHKLGQVVARDRRLAPALRRSLQRLESSQPTVLLSEVLPLISEATGDTPGISIARRPLAEASVAVIVPFTWHAASGPLREEGVFKVLKPNVVEHLEEDLTIWPALGEFLEERSAQLGLPSVAFGEVLSNVAARLANEVRLEREQDHLTRAHAMHEDDSRVVVPRLLPMCTPRVTAMQRIHGVKVTDIMGTAARRRALASLIAEALLARPFWDPADVAVFHADPHAGNLLATADGRLGVLDWSLVAHLDGAQRAAIVQMMLGAVCLDAGQVERAIRSLAAGDGGNGVARDIIEDAVDSVRRGVLPGFDWLTTLLDRLAASGNFTFGDDLLMFRKGLVSLAGVLADVAPGPTIDRTLATSGVTQWLAELSRRTLSTDVTRRFGTHVSNAELMEFWASLSAAPARFWLGNVADVLGSSASGAGRSSSVE